MRDRINTLELGDAPEFTTVNDCRARSSYSSSRPKWVASSRRITPHLFGSQRQTAREVDDHIVAEGQWRNDSPAEADCEMGFVKLGQSCGTAVMSRKPGGLELNLGVYRMAEEVIGKGLSPIARGILGLGSGLMGVIMIGVRPGTEKDVLFFAMGAFFLAIAVACFTRGRVRQFFGSFIGLSLFGLSLAYLYWGFTSHAALESNRSTPSLLNSVLFLVAFGIPGIRYVVRARFGIRRAPASTAPNEVRVSVE